MRMELHPLFIAHTTSLPFRLARATRHARHTLTLSSLIELNAHTLSHTSARHHSLSHVTHVFTARSFRRATEQMAAAAAAAPAAAAVPSLPELKDVKSQNEFFKAINTLFGTQRRRAASLR